MKDYRNRKPFAITLDTVYMDSSGSAINIILIIGLCDLVWVDSRSKCEILGFIGV